MSLSDKNRDAEMRAGRRERKNRSCSHMCVWHSRTLSELRLGQGRGRHDEDGRRELPLLGARFALNTRKEGQEAEAPGPLGPVLLPGSRT